MIVKLIIYITFAISFYGVFAISWLPAVAYWTVSLLQPHYIWVVDLQGIPASKYLAIFSILAWAKMAVAGKIDFSVYKRKQNFILLSMWLLVHLSDRFSPYPVYFAGTRAEIVLSAMNSIMILYFVTLGLITSAEFSEQALKACAVVFTFVIVYYIYWANYQYFTYNWAEFFNGRLTGPDNSPYRDENALAVFVVMGMPLILFGIFVVKQKYQKIILLGLLPLLWHSLFLFGSRGSLIAVAVATILAARLTKSKAFNKLLIVGLVGAVLTQGGAILNRSAETVDKAQDSEETKPLNPRLVSWEVAFKLIKNYPLLGAGSQRFQMAAHEMFPGESVHVAHNTFLNFSANCGLPVGLLYLFLFWLAYKNYVYCVKNGISEYPLLDYLNKACSVSLVGFFIGAIFLDLIIFESFYFILLLNLAKSHVFERMINKKQQTPIETTIG